MIIRPDFRDIDYRSYLNWVDNPFNTKCKVSKIYDFPGGCRIRLLVIKSSTRLTGHRGFNHMIPSSGIECINNNSNVHCASIRCTRDVAVLIASQNHMERCVADAHDNDHLAALRLGSPYKRLSRRCNEMNRNLTTTRSFRQTAPHLIPQGKKGSPMLHHPCATSLFVACHSSLFRANCTHVRAWP